MPNPQEIKTWNTSSDAVQPLRYGEGLPAMSTEGAAVFLPALPNTTIQKKWKGAESPSGDTSVVRLFDEFVWDYVDSQKRYSSSSLSIHDLQLRNLAKYYVLIDPARVKNFLADHPELIPALIEAATHQFDVLKPRGKTAISLVTYSVEYDDQQLCVNIPTTLGVTEGLRALEHFDNSWWLDQPDEIRSLISFDLRYK